MSIGLRLAKRRAAVGLSQYDVAAATGIARSQVAGYEHGRHEPSLAALVSLADALGTTADWLLGREGATEPAEPAKRAKATEPPPEPAKAAARRQRPPEAAIEAIQRQARAMGLDYVTLDGLAYRFRGGGWESV